MKNKVVKILTIVFLVVSIFAVLVVPSFAWETMLPGRFFQYVPNMPDLHLNFLPSGDVVPGRRVLYGWVNDRNIIHDEDGSTVGVDGSFAKTYERTIEGRGVPTVGYYVEVNKMAEVFIDFGFIPDDSSRPDDDILISASTDWAFNLSVGRSFIIKIGYWRNGILEYFTTSLNLNNTARSYTISELASLSSDVSVDPVFPEFYYNGLASIQFAYEVDYSTYDGNASVFVDINLGSTIFLDYYSNSISNIYSYGYELGYARGLLDGGASGGIDQEELDRLLAESRQEGYDEGYDIGYDEGYQEGEYVGSSGAADDVIAAYEEGYQVGHLEGYTQGLTEGRTLGFDEGYQQGLTDGNDLGDKGLFSWIIESVGAFLDMDLGLGISIGGIFMTLGAIGVLMLLLKLIAGG